MPTSCNRKLARTTNASAYQARRVKSLVCITLITVTQMTVSVAAADEWKPAAGPLMTRWTKDISPENVHPEYPRPQMVRKNWTNLNGLWDYAIRPKDEAQPDQFDGQILVPFPVESALSGVMKKVGPDNRLWYRRRIPRPEITEDSRLLLHFGAVDWQTTVWVNGNKIGEHQGGYDPFTFDITDAIGTTKSTHDEIVVSVWDPTDAGYQPRGKQVAEPRGIWYTSVTGIWQTVWLEAVPQTYIKSLRVTPSLNQIDVDLFLNQRPSRSGCKAVVYAGEREVASTEASEEGFSIVIPDPRLWSPDDPFLYRLTVTTNQGDSIESYFAMRSVEVKKDIDGFNRIFLNGKPLFLFGPLDQGWWPDGLYTAPTDEALRYDIEVLKQLGMNVCRKHVKVESERFYYWCDKLGLMVWQDMPNGDRHISPRAEDIERSAESEANFRREYKALIDSHRNHPCIVAWVPFNEGWGQFKTNEILAWTKELDPTRLVDGPSGWTDRGAGDLHDMHRYPGPEMPAPEAGRAVVLGEFGGLGWPAAGHLWWDKRNWGYRTYATQAELQQNYDGLMRNLRPLIGKGLAAAIYTQTTDVEGEVNGLMTYDRAIVKLDVEKVAKTHARFYEPPPIIKVETVVPTSETLPQRWRFTTDSPAEAWTKPDFDDSAWKQGEGGFGEKSTPGSVVRSDWKSADIWLRRTFELDRADFTNPHLRVHHDEDAEIYINGKLAAKLAGYVTDYAEVEISNTARAAIRAGVNTLAVHCHQTGGGQYIDVGLVEVMETPRKKHDDR